MFFLKKNLTIDYQRLTQDPGALTVLVNEDMFIIFLKVAIIIYQFSLIYIRKFSDGNKRKF